MPHYLFGIFSSLLSSFLFYIHYANVRNSCRAGDGCQGSYIGLEHSWILRKGGSHLCGGLIGSRIKVPIILVSSYYYWGKCVGYFVCHKLNCSLLTIFFFSVYSPKVWINNTSFPLHEEGICKPLHLPLSSNR